MGTRLRRTPALIAVLELLHKGPAYGREIMKNTGLATGTVYPLLGRMETGGWVTSYWGDEVGMPRRRYYELTLLGQQKVQERRSSLAF
jgi:PadR family transcriptional regulator PadR